MKLQNLSIIKETLKYEKKLLQALKAVGLAFQNEDSPLDISFLNESFALMGIPEEYALTHLKSHDQLVDTYVSIVHGEIPVNKGLKKIEKLVSKETANKYDPQTNPDTDVRMVFNYLNKIINLTKALKTLNVSENSSLKFGHADALTLALLGISDGVVNSDHVGELWEVIVERKRKPAYLIKKYISPRFKP